MNKYLLYFFLFTSFSFSQDDNHLPEESEGERQVNFAVVEKVPVFPGCEDLENREALECFNKQMRNHILKKFSYPEEAQNNKIEGKVYVSFLINKDGDVVDVITRGADSILQTAAKNIFLSLPKMKPGIQRGKPVNVRYVMPINFKLH